MQTFTCRGLPGSRARPAARFRQAQIPPASRQSRDRRVFHTQGPGHKSTHFVICVLSVHRLPHLPIFATSCHIPHFLVTVHDRELRHFCDEPVCPDPVWKPSEICRSGSGLGGSEPTSDGARRPQSAARYVWRRPEPQKCAGMLFKSWQSGLVVTPVLFRDIRPPSGARGMAFEKCYDWAKEHNRKMSRAKRPVL